jgi:RNA polymerase sigma factor (TIGR02999 family)
MAAAAKTVSLTEQLRAFSTGDREAANAALSVIWPRLRQIAARRLGKERFTAPVTPTELIHETWLRHWRRGGWNIRNREHFFCIAGDAMRCVLVDFARNRLALKRGGFDVPASLSACVTEPTDTSRAQQLVDIGLLVEKLGHYDQQCLRVVDLHYFLGLTFREIAKILNLHPRQVRQLWLKGRDWLREQLPSG